jgi:two-component system KDP operon response regulator KdpE
MRIWVLDGERPARSAFRLKLAHFLEQHGHSVTVTAPTITQPEPAARDQPDFIFILDLGRSELSGVDLCGQLREWTQAPAILLSVRQGEQQKIAALNRGADDYVTRPFRLGELMARMQAVLRRCGAGEAAVNTSLAVSGLQIDYRRRRVTRAGEEVRLTPTEFELLRHLTLNPDRVLTHEELLARVWGKERSQDSHTLRVHVANLRNKIEADPSQPQLLQTEPRVGYRFCPGRQPGELAAGSEREVSAEARA